ncbi:Hypothetical predicted protein [Cloeon dipterum]|uniref:Hexosyltransferase n=1 Tax=Cloeon dipterum TaxID=197152 RepID=A0A8S1DWN7_9INSE|nr:Hypothetical predicted protein [Cloeon dipterum]
MRWQPDGGNALARNREVQVNMMRISCVRFVKCFSLRMALLNSLKILALITGVIIIFGYHYLSVSHKINNWTTREIQAVSLKPPLKLKFNIEDFLSNEPNVSSKYPGGFLRSPECPAEELEILILVFSAPGNFERRKAIRENWAQDLNNSTSLFFILGGVEVKERDREKLEFEQDVILANFTDSYRNLTLKTVALLDWAGQNCEFTFLLKCDDDMYINYPKLRHKLFEENAVFDNKTIIGRLAAGWKPNRSKKSKYYLSKTEFPPQVLPDFMSGPSYVITAGLIEPLLSAVLEEHWLNLEDVLPCHPDKDLQTNRTS